MTYTQQYIWEKKQSRQRDLTVDIMKGIAIIAVIIGHIPELPSSVIRLCYSFHMPLFFLVAGYFFRPNQDKKADIIKSAKRLLIPYAVVVCLMALYGFINTLEIHKWNEAPLIFASGLYGSGCDHHSLIMGRLRPVGAIWFLPALFWCKSMFNVLYTYKYRYIYCFLLAIIATSLDYYIINLPFAILPGLSALTFYAIGDIYKTYTVNKSILFLSVLAYPVSYRFCNTSMANCSYEFYPLAVIGACGGTLVIAYISKAIGKVCYVNHLLSWIGQVSLIVLCSHWLERYYHVYDFLGLPNELQYLLPYRIIMPLLITWICTKISITRKLFQV